ncbi:MAG: hypothetical protein KC731_32705, partial [Myxococcales bacterium]|nr:hypothetical protein [Myxococcales bacterium]
MLRETHHGLTVLADAARRCLRRNAFLTLRAHDGRMTAAVFGGVLALLVALRVGSLLTLWAAHAGWFLDARFWVSDAPMVADHVTPFHGHPNPFGWRFGFQGLVTMHVVTGVGLFAVCLVPLFTAKGKPWHVRFGRAFVLLWLVHLFNGLINSAQILLVRGFEPTRYPQVPGQGFSLYLYVQFAFISFLVIDFLAHGLAALQYKNRPPSRG